MVNWTYIWTTTTPTEPEVNKDLGYATYPETVEGEESRPPYGGISIGVSKYSNHVDEAMEAAQCITKPENQGVNAELTGNMPASSAGYDYTRAGRRSIRSRCSTSSSTAWTRPRRER